MLKTYRIIPYVFILFLFGFTLITVAPVFAQTVDQLIERIEALDANDRAKVLEYLSSPQNRPSDATTIVIMLAIINAIQESLFTIGSPQT